MSYHVRDVLESARDSAPAAHTTADDIIARGRRMRTRRTATALVGGGLAVAAALALIPNIGSSSSDGGGGGDDLPIAAARVSPLLTLPEGFRAVVEPVTVGAYRIGPVGEITAGYQEVPVYRDGETWQDDKGRSYPLVVGTITLYHPGVFNPKDAWDDGYAVTVAGRPGIGREISYAVQPGSSFAPPSGGEKYVHTAVAWQYASDAWATYIPRDLDGNRSADDALAIAAAVTGSKPRAIRVPYRLAAVPEGWQTIAVTETPEKISPTVSEVFLHNGPLPASTLVDEMIPDFVKITVIKGEPKDASIRGKDGVHCYTQPSCTIVDGDYLIDVEGRFSGGLTAADIRKLAEGLQPVDIANRAKWVPADS